MLVLLHARKKVQMLLGFLLGICFGFLLQKGGVTSYDVIIGQLLFNDFTVVKIMLTAVLTGMIGVYLMRSLGWCKLHPKPGSFGSSAIGGLIFGVGFGILGYCPGTVIGAVAQGSMDALLGGTLGILLGSSFLAAVYPKLELKILNKGNFGDVTIPQLLNVNAWTVVVPVAAIILGLLFYMEKIGV